MTIPRLQFTHTFENETSHGAHCVLGNCSVAGNLGIPCIQKMHVLITVFTQHTAV